MQASLLLLATIATGLPPVADAPVLSTGGGVSPVAPQGRRFRFLPATLVGDVSYARPLAGAVELTARYRTWLGLAHRPSVGLRAGGRLGPVLTSAGLTHGVTFVAVRHVGGFQAGGTPSSTLSASAGGPLPLQLGFAWADLATVIEWGVFTEERYDTSVLHRAYDLTVTWAPSPSAGVFLSLLWRRPATGLVGPDLTLPTVVLGGRWS